MQISKAADAAIRPHDKDHRVGRMDNRILLKGEEGTPDNFKLNVSFTPKEWRTPRHRHDFDQIRVPLEGAFEYGEGKVLTVGQVAYFPAGVYYGPQVRKAGLRLMLCQLGSADGQGFVSTAQREAVFDSMKQRGTFHDGMYTYIDKDGQEITKDAGEAVREVATGRPVRYPEPRYGDIVTMHMASFHWIDAPDMPGVAVKHLGTFTERGTRIGCVRVAAGATLQAGSREAKELLFLISGQIRAEGDLYGPQTAFGLALGEGPVPLQAETEAELFRIHLPRF